MEGLRLFCFAEIITSTCSCIVKEATYQTHNCILFVCYAACLILISLITCFFLDSFVSFLLSVCLFYFMLYIHLSILSVHLFLYNLFLFFLIMLHTSFFFDAGEDLFRSHKKRKFLRSLNSYGHAPQSWLVAVQPSVWCSGGHPCGRPAR